MRKFFILISIPFIFTISFIGIQLFLPEEQLVGAQLLQEQMPQINCRSLIKKHRNSSSKINIYSDIPRHEKVTSCVFRPYLWDIMNSSLALKFSPINEKEICRRLKEKLGSIRGICATKYRLK